MARWLIVVVLVSAWPMAAMAEQSDAERRAAAAFDRATRLYRSEDFLAAAEAFEEANRLVPSASVHYNIARSYELAELPALAAQHYRAFLEAHAGNPQRRQQVQDRLEELSEGLGWVNVATTPPGATISVDQRDRGESPVFIALPIGTHEILAEGDGGSASRTVDVRASEISINLRLRPDLPDEPEPVAETGGPDEPEPVETIGEHAATGRGIARLHHSVFWVALGLTIGAGVALAVVGTQLLQLEDDYAYQRVINLSDDVLVELAAQGRRYEQATTALWITTGVLLAATVAVAIFTNWRGLRRHGTDSARRIRWSIAAGRGGALSLLF